MILIGLHGRMGSGKDTAAALIKERYSTLQDNGSAIVATAAFADPLKRACFEMFGGDLKNYFGTQKDKEKELPFWKEQLGDKWGTYRDILQQYGTQVIREHLHQDFWIMCMQRRIETAKAEGAGIFIITDLRFPNEAKMIKALGGHIVHVVYTENRNPVKLTYPKWWQFWKSPEPHASERPLPKELINTKIETSTISQLEDRVETLVTNLVARDSTNRYTR